MKVRLLLAVLPLVTCGLWAASPAVDELPLAEKLYPQLDPILKQAVERSPRMISQSLALEMAEQNRIQARAGLLPYLSGYGRFLRTEDDRADQPDPLRTNKTYYDVSLTQPVFYWGERKNSARIGKISEQIAEGNYREAYRGIALEIRAMYVALIMKKIYVARCKYNADFSQQQLRLAEEKLAKKTISEIQASMYRSSAEQADLTLDRVTWEFEGAKRSFARVTGLEKFTDDDIPDAVPVLKYPKAALDQLLAAYLAEKDPVTTEAVNMRYQIQVEKLNLANNKTRLLPKFNLTLGLSQDEQRYTANLAPYQVNSLYAGVGVSWTLFDGLASRAAVRSSLARNRQIANDYQQTVDRLTEQAQNGVKYIGFSARSMSITDRALEGAQGLLKTQQEEFKRGGVAESDVSIAELGVYDARLNAVNQRADYLYKVAEFLGHIVEDPVLENVNLAHSK